MHKTANQISNLVDPIFHGVNILFVLSFANEDGGTSHSNYYLPKVTTKDYNAMINSKRFWLANKY